MFKNNLPLGKATWDNCLSFLQVFFISVKSDSDSEHHRASLLYNINIVPTFCCMKDLNTKSSFLGGWLGTVSWHFSQETTLKWARS